MKLSAPELDPWFRDNLVCPIAKESLTLRDGWLVSTAGRRYPVVAGIPVMLVEDAEQTIGIAEASLQAAVAAQDQAPVETYFWETVAVTPEKRREGVELASRPSTVDPVVSMLVAATCGLAYRDSVGRLEHYPIPLLRLPKSDGDWFLDVGCSWGRWSMAAADLGYRTVGIDPSLGATLAARRVAKQTGRDCRFIVADARFLPFPDKFFDVVFSYSVLQHFSVADAACAIGEIGRVLRPGGASFVQMAHRIGVRSIYHQLRRRGRPVIEFDVRYWSMGNMRRAFADAIGPSDFEIDCFFGLGLQESDMPLMSPLARNATRASALLRQLSGHLPFLRHAADSLYVRSIKQPVAATA